MHDIKILFDFINEFGVNALTDKYGINVTPHKTIQNLVTLKYDQIDSPMGEPIVQVCRGIVIDTSNMRVVARPFDKFFNYGEFHAAPVDYSSAFFYEKLDGSLMTMYEYNGSWHVASSGTPDASGNINNIEGMTFASIFWKGFEKAGFKIPSEEHRDFTFMFELMSPFNRVVVKHDGINLKLIGVRNRVTGQEYDVDSFKHQYDVVKKFDVSTVEAAKAVFDELSGDKFEGFVICDKDFNRVKMKHPTYVVYHHTRSSFSAESIVEITRSNEIDEFTSVFPETRPAFDDFVKNVDEAVSRITTLMSEHSRKERKDFALAVKDDRLSSIMFTAYTKKRNDYRALIFEARNSWIADVFDLKTSLQKSALQSL